MKIFLKKKYYFVFITFLSLLSIFLIPKNVFASDNYIDFNYSKTFSDSDKTAIINGVKSNSNFSALYGSTNPNFAVLYIPTTSSYSPDTYLVILGDNSYKPVLRFDAEYGDSTKLSLGFWNVMAFTLNKDFTYHMGMSCSSYSFFYNSSSDITNYLIYNDFSTFVIRTNYDSDTKNNYYFRIYDKAKNLLLTINNNDSVSVLDTLNAPIYDGQPYNINPIHNISLTLLGNVPTEFSFLYGISDALICIGFIIAVICPFVLIIRFLGGRSYDK